MTLMDNLKNPLQFFFFTFFNKRNGLKIEVKNMYKPVLCYFETDIEIGLNISTFTTYIK